MSQQVIYLLLSSRKNLSAELIIAFTQTITLSMTRNMAA